MNADPMNADPWPPRSRHLATTMHVAAAGAQVRHHPHDRYPAVSIRWDRGADLITFDGTPTELEALGGLIIDAARQLWTDGAGLAGAVGDDRTVWPDGVTPTSTGWQS